MNKEVSIPSLGALDSSKVVEILVKPSQRVEKDMSLITLESDKASMDFPSPFTGVVDEIKIKEGDEVSEGSVILTLRDVEESVTQDEQIEQKKEKPVKKDIRTQGDGFYASPFVRRMAMELEIDLSEVEATGDGGRITIDDMKSFLLKDKPKVIDYAQWGKVEFEAMGKIQSISSQFITRAWQQIPQVTQHHWVDITELEALRQSTGKQVTIMVLVMKALVDTMKKHPVFCRGWIDETQYALRKYYHVGFAVDTPAGLMVPVCKNVDTLDVLSMGKMIKDLSDKARQVTLKAEEMEGRCVTISSLGGIGGGHFTPIVTSPDSFILGLSRSSYQGVYQGDSLEKRYLLPISLSYDHRLIDGADAARFLVDLEQALVTMHTKQVL